MWPLGHGMNTLLNCPDKSKDMLKREMCALSLCYQTMETMVLKDMDYSQESNAGRKESMKLCSQQGRNLPLRKRFQRVLTIHQNTLYYTLEPRQQWVTDGKVHILGLCDSEWNLASVQN